MNVLHGHDSADTAHLTLCYPFGRRVKCVRREWVETATKGAKRGQQRFVTQTSHPRFNAEYTARIGSDGQAAADAWVEKQMRVGAVRWNKPHGATYSALVVMVEGPLQDGSDRVGISHVSLSPYAGPSEIARFTKQVAEQLDDGQRRRFAPLECAAVATAAR